jgi:hypothetical protein
MHLLMSENYFIVGDEVMKNAGDAMENPVNDYVPPQVLKMNDMRMGEGDCMTGSGDKGDCEGAGMKAGDHCRWNGSSAGTRCSSSGSSALGKCAGSGNSPGL